MKLRPIQTLSALAVIGIAAAGLSTGDASASQQPSSSSTRLVARQAAVRPAGYVADYETYTVGSNVAVRSCTHVASCSTPLYTIGAAGAAIDIKCWKAGDSVNGDTTWYYLTWMGHAEPFGYMTGYYAQTGQDPNPQIRPC